LAPWFCSGCNAVAGLRFWFGFSCCENSEGGACGRRLFFVLPDRRGGSPDRRIAGSPDRRIAGSPDRRIAGSPDRRIAGSPDRRGGRRRGGSPEAPGRGRIAGAETGA